MSEEKPTWYAAGIVHDLPFDQYQARPGVNASSIAHGRKSMLHMRQAMTEPTEPTPAMEFGTLCHYVILEGGAGLVCCDARRGTKAWDAAIIEAGGFDRLVCKPAEYDAAHRMRDMVMACEDAAWLIGRTQHEVSLFWRGNYGPAKARPDMFAPGETLADYNSTGDITPFRFFGVAERLGYHVKMGWYSEGAELLAGRRPDVFVIVQEAKPPYDCWVCTMAAEIVEAGREEAVEIATRYRAHEVAGSWPGVVTDGNMIEY
jgi:hypothetical protein